MQRVGLNEYVTLYMDFQGIRNQIDNIYYGYRRCYSNKPFATKFDVTTVNKALHDYRQIVAKQIGKPMDSPDVNTEITHQLGGSLEDIIDFLCKCMFIKKHMHHESPLEHGNMTVVVEGASRACMNQWVRHRICAHSQASLRYISVTNPTVVMPHSFEKSERAQEIFKSYIGQLPPMIAELKELGIPDEDIRYLYPLGITTSIQTTANYREWMHIFHERTCNRAQLEIKEIVKKIYEQFTLHIPFVFDDVAPKCRYLKRCPEDPSCGMFQALSSD